MKITVSSIQFNTKFNKFNENLRKAVEYLEKAFKKGAKCVLLQEMWAFGHQKEASKECVEFTPKALKILCGISKEYKGVIIAGSLLEPNNNELPYNTSYIIGPNGEIISKYRKVHLFPLMNEERKYCRGSELCIFDLFEIKAGVVICYDIRFPEEIRALADKSVDVLFVPAMWQYERKKHWLTLLTARALENQIYVVGANSVGEDNNIQFAGNSVIISPDGEIQELIEYKEGVITHDIDINKLEYIRKSMPVIESKRRDLYKKWVE